MYKVKLTEKDAKSKKEMAFCSRDHYKEQDLKAITLEKKAGFIHTGEYPNFTLLVFDFDLCPELKGSNYLLNHFEWFKRINRTKPYLKVFTPSGGLHLYYIFKEVFEFPNRAKLRTFDASVVCDIRGHNGIIFAPGSKFEDEKYPREYFILDKNCEKVEHTKEELQDLYSIFELDIERSKDKPMLHYDIILQKKENIPPPIIEYSSSKEYPSNFWRMVYDGHYKINHGPINKIPEYLVWRNLWLWIYHQKIDFEEAMNHLEKTQLAFNRKETELQLKYVNFGYYPSSKISTQLYKYWNSTKMEVHH